MIRQLNIYHRRKRHRLLRARLAWSAAIIAVVVVLLLLMWPGWAYHWGWTGLGAHYGPPKDKAGDRDYFPAKTGWDWLQLLIIPVALAIVGIIVNRTDKRRDQEIAENRQQEAALEAYLSTMTTLLLDKGLAEAKDAPTSETGPIRAVAHAQTLTVLKRLGGVQKGAVVRFLYESDLINRDKPIVVLIDADLREADLSGTDLREANLAFTNLRGATLEFTNASGADLTGAVLWDTDLRGANLTDADLGMTGVHMALNTTDEQLKQAKSLPGAAPHDETKQP